MPDREKVISGLQYTIEMFLFDPATGHSKDPDDLNYADRITYDACIGAIAMLKEQEPMSPEEFKNGLLNMFSSIWDSEIDHPVFQDTVGDLMSGVIQLYKEAVKLE